MASGDVFADMYTSSSNFSVQPAAGVQVMITQIFTSNSGSGNFYPQNGSGSFKAQFDGGGAGASYGLAFFFNGGNNKIFITNSEYFSLRSAGALGFAYTGVEM